MRGDFIMWLGPPLRRKSPRLSRLRELGRDGEIISGLDVQRSPARRLTIITQWFPPEQAPFGKMMAELGNGLAANGWDVTVVTGFPNHPQGSVFSGYRKRW